MVITLETHVEKGHLAPSNLTFLLIARNGFRRMKEEGLIYKMLPDFLIFELSYDLSKFSDDFTPFFRFERPSSPQAKIK